MKGLTTEQKILFILLKDKVSSLPGEFSGDNFIKLLQRHKLLPIAEQLLSIIDEGTKAAWKVKLHNWFFRSTSLFKELKIVGNQLEQNDIVSISIKGPLLSNQLYQNSNARFYTDLDLIVKPHQLKNAVDVMVKAGYSLKRPTENLNEKEWEKYFVLENDVGLVHKEKRIYIELHRGIYVPGLLEEESEALFLGELQKIEIQGTTFHTLHPTQYFLYLCFHGAKHMYFRLCWLRDVAEFIKNEEIDHAKVCSLAKELKIEKLLSVSLILANKYFNTLIPPEYESILKLKGVNRLAKLSDKIIRGPGRARFHRDVLLIKGRKDRIRGIDKASIGDWLNRLFFSVLLLNSTKDKLTYVRRIFVENRTFKRK